MEWVVLVDKDDCPIGTMEKIEAHRGGFLHRAFSVLLYNSKGEMLLQKRSAQKYHSGGLWTNSCCSHSLPGEAIEVTVKRKLMQELGIETDTKFLYKFFYRTQFISGMIEHECDYVFTGVFDGTPILNSDEAEDWKFVAIDQLLKEVITHPNDYTSWFKIILNHLYPAGWLVTI